MDAHPNSTDLNNLQAGDYRIGLVIEDNPGYSSSGFRLEYNAENYDLFIASAPIFLVGPAGAGLSFEITLASPKPNTLMRRIAISTSGPTNNTYNGEIIYFFLKEKANPNPNSPNPIVTLTIMQLADEGGHDLVDEEVERGEIHNPEDDYHYIIFYYILGDINGDGEVDTVDSTVLQQILNYMASHNATIEQACEYYSSVTAGIGTPELLYITLVTDVNYDNLINADDVEDIQEYYQFIILEEPISSQIGQFMCFTMLVPVTP